MLYLVKSNSAIKIGSTNNLYRRIKAYKTNNPEIEFLELAEGGIKEEKELHNKLLKYKYKNCIEWFKDCKEVRDIWKEYRKNKEIPNIEIYKAQPHYHRIDPKFVESLGEEIIYNKLIIDLNKNKIYNNILEWLDSEELSSQSIYNLYKSDSNIRFLNPEEIFFPFGNSNYKCTMDEIYKPYIKEEKQLGVSWIREKLENKYYTYSELKELFIPIFEEHGLKWNKQHSIKDYFPSYDKKRIMVNKKLYTYYIFNTF